MAGNNAASTNRREYECRINRVMDYVSQNLTEPLTLEKLAGVAAFSPFHFHRVFKSYTGESLSNFVAHPGRVRSIHAYIVSSRPGISESGEVAD